MKHNRIASAAAEYNRKFTNNKYGKGAFYASDFYEIKELAEKSGGYYNTLYTAIDLAITAGFMIGYRSAKREAKKR